MSVEWYSSCIHRTPTREGPSASGRFEKSFLLADNPYSIRRGHGISISANGYAKNEAMNAWLFSDPVLLGNATTNDNGSVESKFEVPNAPADGAHTLQIRLIDADGRIVSFAIPIVLMSEVPNGAA